MRFGTAALGMTAWFVAAPAALAAEPSSSSDAALAPRREVREEIPITAYTYTAYGSRAGTVGAYGYGHGLLGNRKPTFGGGATVWGSPIDRLTIIGDAQRNVFGHFSPSAALLVRILGTPGDGFSLGGLGKFKIAGFGIGPNDEVESETEFGLLLSYARAGWHVDLNSITGIGLGDDGEVDTEGRLRLGYDLSDVVRLGVDGQARVRLAGTYRLPGNRTADFAAGPQVVIGSSHFFGSLTAGPATMGITDRTMTGWTAVLSVGGMN
jgi:hypothetical protein